MGQKDGWRDWLIVQKLVPVASFIFALHTRQEIHTKFLTIFSYDGQSFILHYIRLHNIRSQVHFRFKGQTIFCQVKLQKKQVFSALNLKSACGDIWFNVQQNKIQEFLALVWVGTYRIWCNRCMKRLRCRWVWNAGEGVAVGSSCCRSTRPSSGRIVSHHTRQMLSRHDVINMFDTPPLQPIRIKSILLKFSTMTILWHQNGWVSVLLREVVWNTDLSD